MSHVIHPVGPQPPSVYWVRRVLVVIVVALVVLGAVWLVGGRGGGGAPVAIPSASPTPVPSPTPSTPKPSPTPTPPATPATSTSPGTKPTTSASTTPPCKDAEILVTASTDAATYPVGSTPRLRMQITNTSSHSCVRDVGAQANTLLITKAGAKFWSSDDCSPGGAPGPATIAPGQSYSVTVTWPGQASSPGCQSNPAAATAGSYALVGRNGNVRSVPAPFSLT